MRHALSLLLATLLLLPAASALYVETPLRLVADPAQAEVGGEVVITIEPTNDTVRETYAGRTLRAVYAYDADENSTSEGDAGNVTLDDAARGTLRWTPPAEVDGQNVWITLLDGEETAGSVHVAVGDAPPIMMATGGAPPEGVDDPVRYDTETPEGGLDAGAEDGASESRQETPAFTALAVVAAAALAVLALGRRR